MRDKTPWEVFKELQATWYSFSWGEREGDGIGEVSNSQTKEAIIKNMWDFPGGAVVKSPPANAGDSGSSPGPGRSRMPQSN